MPWVGEADAPGESSWGPSRCPLGQDGRDRELAEPREWADSATRKGGGQNHWRSAVARTFWCHILGPPHPLTMLAEAQPFSPGAEFGGQTREHTLADSGPVSFPSGPGREVDQLSLPITALPVTISVALSAIQSEPIHRIHLLASYASLSPQGRPREERDPVGVPVPSRAPGALAAG